MNTKLQKLRYTRDCLLYDKKQIERKVKKLNLMIALEVERDEILHSKGLSNIQSKGKKSA